MLQREATYPMKSFLNGWVQLEELHQSCWRILRSWSCSSRLWRLTCMSWRTTGQLTTLSFWAKCWWFTLDLFTSAAGATNQRAHSCLAQSHVLMERMTSLMIYRVSALLTIFSLLFIVERAYGRDHDLSRIKFSRDCLRDRATALGKWKKKLNGL